MANDWIKMRLDLAEDPAVIAMADALNVREETIVGYCHAFWSFVSRQCHDGTVTGITLTSLGRRLNLPGFPELLVKVGWLVYDESDGKPLMTIPNFDRHLSQSAKSRGLAAIRKSNSRSHGSVPGKSRIKRDKSVTRYILLFSTLSSDSSPRKDVSETALQIKVPDQLDTDRFRQAWSSWEEHHRDIKKPLTPTSVQKQIQKLASLGADASIAAIEHSIANGWIGIFEPDSKASKKTPPKPKFGGEGKF